MYIKIVNPPWRCTYIKVLRISIYNYQILKTSLQCYIWYMEFVTQHEKIVLMCTKYTPLQYSMYLILCVRYTSSVNCIKISMVYYRTCKSFILILFWAHSYEISKSKKWSNFICTVHTHYFLMPGHIWLHWEAVTPGVLWFMVMRIQEKTEYRITE